MAVLKYKDPITGEIKRVGTPIVDAYSKEEANVKFAPSTHASQHGYSDTITWNGNLDKFEIKVSSQYPTTYVLVSEQVPSWDDIYNKATISTTRVDGTVENFTANDEYCEQVDDDLITVGTWIVIVKKDNYGEGTAFNLPKKGVYFIHFDHEVLGFYTSRFTIPGYNFGGNDPITPEMIGAASASHALEHRAGDILTWDGDTSERLFVLMSEEEYDGEQYAMRAYHISDEVPTSSSCASGIFTEVIFPDGSKTCENLIPEEWINLSDGFMGLYTLTIVPTDNYFINDDNGFYVNITFPKKGIYVMRQFINGQADAYISSVTIPNYPFFNIPDTITPEMIGAMRIGETYHLINNHSHSMYDFYGTLPVSRGGTGNSSVDTTPTSGSTKMVTSNGIYQALSQKAPSTHTQSASTITAGTFAGAVVAQTSSQTPGTSMLRNSKLVSTETTPSYNGEIYWTYE